MTHMPDLGNWTGKSGTCGLKATATKDRDGETLKSTLRWPKSHWLSAPHSVQHSSNSGFYLQSSCQCLRILNSRESLLQRLLSPRSESLSQRAITDGLEVNWLSMYSWFFSNWLQFITFENYNWLVLSKYKISQALPSPFIVDRKTFFKFQICLIRSFSLPFFLWLWRYKLMLKHRTNK